MRNLLIPIALIGALGVQAQTGLRGGSDGMRQISAQTLGRSEVLFGFGGEAASGYDLLTQQRYTTTQSTGSQAVAVDSYRPVAVTGYANLGVGLASFWDLGVSMPLYYDHFKPSKGSHTTAMGDSWGGGQGDLQVHTKVRVPFKPDYPLQMAALGMLNTPTGKESTGFYPRHLANVGDPGTATHPFTSQYFMVGGGLAMTLDLEPLGVPMRFNGYGAYQYPWEYGKPEVVSWAFGLNQKSWEYATTFVEMSGEHRRSVLAREMQPLCDRMLATAGLRFHLPSHWDFGVAADFSPVDRGNIDIVQTSDAGTTRYSVGNPNFGVSALLLYNSGRKDLDADKDGVPDRIDKCHNTPSEAQADQRGCPLDQDQDGIGDYKDKCPGTLQGITVEPDGCAKDADADGISDFQDQCPSTPKGMPVDARGCSKDTDKDGIPDPLDKCPATLKGIVVDSNGCAADADQDGVPDNLDRCPKTPAGIPVNNEGCPADADKDGIADLQDKCPGTSLDVMVDTTGCPRDIDHDGVADYLDKCPATAKGLAVDTQGCPSDIDGDGVRNENDMCPGTPAGLMVNQSGCPADTDKDGVADFLDKCPGTPAGAPVDTLGCPADADGDGVPDFKDKCPRTLKGVEIRDDGCPLKKEQDLTQLQRAINFQSGSAVLTKDSYKTLDLVVALLKAIPTAKLEIQGHTDNTGSAEKNTQLSKDRAMAVGLYFVSQGIEKSRLRPVGYGPTLPIMGNDTKAGRTANRRVELVPFD